MTDASLLSQHLTLKLSIFKLFTLDETFEVLNFNAYFVEALLVLDILLVENGVVVLEVFVLLGLEGALGFELFDSLL